MIHVARSGGLAEGARLGVPSNTVSRRVQELQAQLGEDFMRNPDPRYAISAVHGYNKQVIVGAAALPTGRWVHVAVTLPVRSARCTWTAASSGPIRR